MSSYLNFYLKDKEGNFHYLNSFSRSTAIYEYGSHYTRYDEGVPMSVYICNSILDDITTELNKYNNVIHNYKERKVLIAQMNNNIEDKLEALSAVDADMEAVDEINDALIDARGFYNTIGGIIDAHNWGDNREDYIYFGIEWCPDYEED